MGINLRMMRERIGITQENMALRSGLTQGYINFLENGKRGYSERSLEKIANALGIRMSELFEEKIKKEPTVVAKQPLLCTKKSIGTIIDLLEKLPAPVIDHYRMLLKAEVKIRNSGSVD